MAQNTKRGERATSIIVCTERVQMRIDATARAASDFGYDVTVVHDACAARQVEFDGRPVSAEDVHSTVMSALAGTYAKVVGCSALLAEKLRS